MAVATVCKITPRLNIQVEMMIAILRPRLSASKGEESAPTSVPMLKMLTIRLSCAGETSRSPSVLT